jgi:hypothetical protein
VLRQGGALSIFEPISRFAFPEPPDRFEGYDVTPVADLAAKLMRFYYRIQPLETDPMIDFDERDLVRLAEDAGFQRIGLELKIQVIRGRRGDWDQFLNSAPNPLSLSLQEAVDRALSPEEAATFIDYMKSAFDNNDVSHRSAMAYFVGVKGEG